MSSTSTAQINTISTYPKEITKTIKFLIQCVEDEAYINSPAQEDNFIADVKDFSANIALTVLEIDGAKVE
jgi:hypothetical protein